MIHVSCTGNINIVVHVPYPGRFLSWPIVVYNITRQHTDTIFDHTTDVVPASILLDRIFKWALFVLTIHNNASSLIVLISMFFVPSLVFTFTAVDRLFFEDSVPRPDLVHSHSRFCEYNTPLTSRYHNVRYVRALDPFPNPSCY